MMYVPRWVGPCQIGGTSATGASASAVQCSAVQSMLSRAPAEWGS